ncbi:hypothetical protein ACP4OV_020639 [Aristida adscensionis]
MPVSDRAAIPSSSFPPHELDPLLRGLVEKKLILKRNVTSMASELKDARTKLASQELLLAQESEARKVAELRARNKEEELCKLQKCLENKDEQLRASLCSIEQHRNELHSLRSQLSVTRATAEATAASAKSALLHCSSLLAGLNDKTIAVSECKLPVNNVAEHLDQFQERLEGRNPSQRLPKDYVLRSESGIEDAFAIIGHDDGNKLLKIVPGVSPKSEKTDRGLMFEEDAFARLGEDIRVLSVHFKNKSKELESQFQKNQRTSQALKKKVLKLEFWLQESRSRSRKLQRMRDTRDKVLKKLGNGVAEKQPGDGGSGNTHLWDGSAFKLIASMSILALAMLGKR